MWLRKKKPYPQELQATPTVFFRKLDRRVLELSEMVGSDNTRMHEISFWMYLPTEDGALSLAKQLQAEKFDVEVSPPIDRRREWLCLAYRTMVPDLDELERIRKQFTKLAKLYDGKFDGWEMEV